MKRLLGLTLAGAVLIGAMATNACAAEITVFAAASLTDALKEIGAGWEKQSGDKVFFNFAASSTLARQIEEGAPADIFFSADEAQMDQLQAKGLILKDTRRSLLSNTLVIVVAAQGGPGVAGPKDLATDKVRRLALAEPRAVPAGIYAKEYLDRQKLWPAIKGKVIPTENVRGALAAVEAGNADAGIVYQTDAAVSTAVKVAYEVPRNEGPDISYPAAVITGTRRAEAARRFFECLESDTATKSFVKYGFIIRKQRGPA